MLQMVAQHHQMMDFPPRRVFVFPEEHLMKVVAAGLVYRLRRATFGALIDHDEIVFYIPIYLLILYLIERIINRFHRYERSDNP